MNNFFKIIVIGAGFIACSCSFKSTVAYQYTTVANVNDNKGIDSLIIPYRQELKQKMQQKITFAEIDFINERPGGNLGNLVADMLLQKAKEDLKAENCIALLNFGGLRSTINKGDVFLEDIYKLMPFDNELIYVRVKREVLDEMYAYLKNSKGEPISGFRIENGQLLPSFTAEEYWIATSDFLLNGGDKMYFLKNNREVIQTGIPIRELLIKAFQAYDTLPDPNESRIVW